MRNGWWHWQGNRSETLRVVLLSSIIFWFSHTWDGHHHWSVWVSGFGVRAPETLIKNLTVMHCVMGRRWISQSLKWMTNKCTCPTWLCGEFGCLKCSKKSLVINFWSAFNFYWILMPRCLIGRAVEPERKTR